MTNINFPEGPVHTQPENINPLQNNHFELVINRLPNTKFFCQTVVLPELNVPHIEQATPFNPVPRQGQKLLMSELEVTFMVHEGMDNYIEIVKWIFDGTLSRSFNTNYTDKHHVENKVYSDGSVHILSSKYGSNLRVDFKDLFPVHLSAPKFSTKESAPSYLSATAKFKFTYFDYVKVNS